MKCPRDGSRLARAKIDGIRLKKCPECAGIWLDFHELEAVCGLKLADVESHLREEVDEIVNNTDAVAGYMRCPRCPNGRLQQITYTILRPVRIDRCDQCLGCWVDHGELDAILQEKQTLDEELSIAHLRML
ncbi:TFIIB-type zinc ribbon-containing protein [Bythopirellula goksoeyrii]|uniref:Transcription factor zinc-finger domain-containing protein n=1 Tax=Bythopirellula goksoeyrii TaxID=1400387 RepID=A0A5B9QGC0_9BACT|nr:zf-TFIIB domain-containing protein [Bythopirellula goksoeyrii]QEG35966.1 hypothetical protein Pr1d_32750 [Bythopirellula goksoeyrii]